MSKKQIKELIIQTASVGTKEAVNEVTALNTALNNAAKSALALTGALKNGEKFINNISKAYENVSKSLETSLGSIRKFNSALNGDAKKATQNLTSYLENLELLNLGLTSAASNANRAAVAMGSMTSASQMSSLIDLVQDLVHIMEDVRESFTNTQIQGKQMTQSLEGGFESLASIMERTEDNVTTTNEKLGYLGNTIVSHGNRAGKATKDTDRLNNSIRRLNATGSSSARAFSSLAFGMNPLVATYAAIAVNVYAATEAFRLLKEASALDRLSDQAAQFSASLTGINIKQLAQDMQEASGYAYALGESMKQSIRGVSYGFTSKELLELTEGARKASVALGIDFTDAMDRVIRGISKQEVELLDELGVVTRLDTAFSKYAATLGKTGDQLTDLERRTALTNEVLSQLQNKYKAFDVAANSFERLGTATKNLTDRTLMRMSRALDGAALGLSKFLESLGPVSTKASLAEENLRIFNKAVEGKNVTVATVALYNYQQAMKGVGDASKTSGNSATQAMENMDTANTVLVASTIALSVAAVAATAAILKMTTGLSLATVAAWSLNTAFAALGRGVMWVVGLFAKFSAGVIAIKALIATGIVIVLATLLDQFGALDWIIEKTKGAVNNFIETWKELGKLFYEYGFQKTGIEAATKKLLGFNKELNNTKANYVELHKIAPWERVNTLDIRKQLGSSGNGNQQAPMSPMRPISAEEAALADNQNKFNLNLAASVAKVQELGLELTYSKTKMQELAGAARNIAPTGAFIDPQHQKAAEDFFNKLKEAGYIAKDAAFNAGEGLRVWADQVDRAASSLATFERTRDTLESVYSASIEGSDRASIKELEYSLSMNNKALAMQAGLGETVNKVEREKLLNSNEVLKAKIAALEKSERLAEVDRQLELLSEGIAANAEIYATSQSTILEREQALLLAKRATLVTENQSTKEIDQKIKLLDIEINKQKQLEALEARKTGIALALQNQEAITAKAGNEQARIASLQKELDLKRAAIEANTQLSSTEKALQTNSLNLEQAQLTGMKGDGSVLKNGALFKDASSVMGNIAGLEGLTDLQSTFSSSMSGISDTYSQFLKDMEGKGGSFMDYLKGNIDGMSNVLSSSLSLAQAAFSQISDAKIASIDAEIEAEKRRDGKSEESLAKIKKLQAQKIKEETKAKKASVIMSTATAIMQAFAQMGPLGAPFAAALGAMGMLQLATIDKAASGQLAGLNSGGANLSVTGGNRTNEIDVSRKANAGELAYLQGAKGTGTAGNFTPGKAIGGYSSAGTSIVVGESGPEVITPAVPVNVTPAGQAGSSVQITLSPVFNTSTIDSSGFEQLTQRFSRELYDGLERELRARNRTLDNL